MSMADTVFSVYPNGQLSSGNGLKGKALRTPLGDLKNTIKTKRANGLEPKGKPDQPLPSKHDGRCKDVPKIFAVRETPAKLKLKQNVTFSLQIACDDEENWWEACGTCGQVDQDAFFDPRPPSLQFKDADIKYLLKGMSTMASETPVHHPEEIPFARDSIFPTSWLDIDYEMPSLPTVTIEEPVPVLDEE